MSKPGQGTDPDYEDARGRLALWLELDDIAWLAKHCVCGTQTGHHTTECVRIRFRAGACLHAHNLER